MENNAVSLIQGEELFFNRLLSKDPSNGFSSRIYYRHAGQVPFQWESHPGKAKVLPGIDPLPPLSPPPAVLSFHLAQEQIQRSRARSNRSWVWFWKKKGKRAQKSKQIERQKSFSDEGSLERLDSFVLWSSEGDESISFPRDSSSSSSSSSSCSSICPAPSPKLPSLELKSKKTFQGFRTASEKMRGDNGVDWISSCTPWKSLRHML